MEKNHFRLSNFFFIIPQKGRDVILYNVYRDHNSPVAKATILSVDRREEVGGQELGSQYCKVVVNYVIKRDAILPRGVGDMTTMGQAQGRCIAWPYKHVSLGSFAKFTMTIMVDCLILFFFYVCSWNWKSQRQMQQCNHKQAEEVIYIFLLPYWVTRKAKLS